jgi:transposase
MSRRLELEITESAEELKTRLHQQSEVKLKERVQALYLLKSEQVTELNALGKVLGRHPSTLYRWFEGYWARGLAGVLELGTGHNGRARAIPPGVEQALKQRLKEPPGFKSYGAIQQWLREEYGLQIKYKTVHQTVRYRLKAKLKVARPSHLHREEAAGVAFKKTSRGV